MCKLFEESTNRSYSPLGFIVMNYLLYVHVSFMSLCVYNPPGSFSSQTVWRQLTDNWMLTVPAFGPCVQPGVYAEGSKVESGCYDDVRLAYASTSMDVGMYTLLTSLQLTYIPLSLPPADSQVTPGGSARIHAFTGRPDRVNTRLAARRVKPV